MPLGLFASTLREVLERNATSTNKNGRRKTPSRFQPAREDQDSCLNTSRAAATVASMSSAVCAALTKPAS
jgi:hypothetical protein